MSYSWKLFLILKYVLRQEHYGCSTSVSSQKREEWLKIWVWAISNKWYGPIKWQCLCDQQSWRILLISNPLHSYVPTSQSTHPQGGELNLDQTGMCYRCLKFITLFWSGKTQKGYLFWSYRSFLKSIVLYCIILYCIVLYCIVLYWIVLYCIVLYCIGDKDHVYALLI